MTQRPLFFLGCFLITLGIVRLVVALIRSRRGG